MRKPDLVRLTISLPRDHRDMLERIAEEKKVSLAWVIREATERYIEELWPLLSGGDRAG